MSFDQAAQVAKQAMIARVPVLVYPLKWQPDQFGVQFQSPQGVVNRESFVQALDALDEFPRSA